MAKRIKISAGVLNVRLHPHTPERYAEFLNDIYALRQPVKLRGDRHGIISLLDRSELEKGIVTGIITTFLDIDFDGEWFSTANLQPASNEQISQVSIPADIHPNAASFYFQLNTSNHRIYFQTYSSGKVFSEKSALTLFSRLADNLAITHKYGNVQITVVQSKEALDRIFSLRTIKSITITIHKPNADIFADDFEEQIEAHLLQTHSKKVTIAYEAEPGGSVVPTAEIRTISSVALENGNVEVKGRDESGAVSLSSNDHPKVIQDKYDPDAMSESQAFRSIVPQGNDEGA